MKKNGDSNSAGNVRSSFGLCDGEYQQMTRQLILKAHESLVYALEREEDGRLALQVLRYFGPSREERAQMRRPRPEQLPTITDGWLLRSSAW